MKLRIIPFFLLLVFNSLIASGAGKERIVFRYDDFLLTPSPLSDSLLNIFRKNRIPLCIGIIPYNKSGKFINGLDSSEITALKSRIENGEVEVALHGYNHQNQIKKYFFSKPTYSEFASVEYDTQVHKLSAGKKALDSLLNSNIKIFVPPFNTYDDNTLKALESLDFEIISASRHGRATIKSLKYLPSTYEDFSELADIIKRHKDEDLAIIVYFHPYTFKGQASDYEGNSAGKMTLEGLDSLLQWLNTQSVLFCSFTDLAKNENFSNEAYQSNSLKYNLLKKTLNYLKIYGHAVLYNPVSQKYRILNSGLIAGNILFHFIIFFMTFWVSCRVLKILKPTVKTVLIFLFICLVPLSAYLFYIRNDYSLGIIVIMLAVISGALILSIFRIYRSNI